jgi:hypothetical protein
MNSMLVFLFVVTVLLTLLGWALRSPRHRDEAAGSIDLAALEQAARRNSTYFSLIERALCSSDMEFLEKHASPRIAWRTRKDRRRVALAYLRELHGDFQRLLRLARVIAVLSPDVAGAEEFERLRLTVAFSFRYRLVYAGLYSGFLLLPQLTGLSQMVSSLAIRMDTAMKELGERAALAAELASSIESQGNAA